MSEGNRKRRRELGLISKEHCAARRQDGQPCGMTPIRGAAVCRMHGGSAPQVIKKARERLALAADDAASWLVKMMNDESVPWSERRRAMETILDRAGISKSVDLELNVDAPWQELIAGIVGEVDDDAVRAHTYEDRRDDIIDGEVVHDSAEVVEPSRAAVRRQIPSR